MPIDVTPLTSSLGARITGLDIRAGLTDEEIDRIRRAVLEHLVVVIPDQHLDEDAQADFAENFGEIRPHPERAFLGDEARMSYIGGEVWRFPEDTAFHTDLSNYPETPTFAVLTAQVIPERGGDTLWSNMYDAYDALSESMQSILGGLRAYHGRAGGFARIRAQQMGNEGLDVAQTDETLAREFPDVAHPIICVHPLTEKPYLFVNRHFTRRIDGFEAAESAALLGFLFDHAEQARFCCRHKWDVGDVVMWDERSTLHQAQGGYWPARRELRRVTVGAEIPRALVSATV